MAEEMQDHAMEGNQMKMREALLKIQEYAEAMDADDWNVLAILDTCRDALSAPARQCDVGTADEQTARYRKFCSDHKFLGSDSSYMCKGFGKGRCPFFNSHTKSQCEFEWAQAPYEEGGAK